MFELPLAFLIPLFFIFGALLGSFANVVIVRMPAGESLAWPGSACRKCKTPIKWYHNVPIFAWFWLRGKCAACGARFSFRYPLVELIMGTLFAFCFYRVGWSWSLLEYLYFIFGLVTVSFIDLDHMILPDKFTLSGIVIGLIGAALNPERDFLTALYGVLMGGGFLWLIAYLYWRFRKVEGMGGGDIKLLAWIGAVLGWPAIPFVILSSSLIGSLIGIILAIRTKGGLKVAIPFGPYLVLGALVYLLLGGAALAQWYLEFHGLPAN